MRHRNIVLRVYCGACQQERRKFSELVGTVVSDGDGSMSWFVYDNRRRRLGNREEFVAGIILRHAGISHHEPPETLFGYCKRHGRGRVFTSDVLGQSGTIVLNLIAPA